MGRKPRESTSITKKFAETLEDLIEEKKKSGLKHEEISVYAGVGSGALSEWASDSKTANIDSLVKLAKYFNVSCDYLLGLSAIKSIAGNEQSAISLGLPNKFVEYAMSLKENDRDKQSLQSFLSSSNFHRAISELTRVCDSILRWNSIATNEDQHACMSLQDEDLLCKEVSSKSHGELSVMPSGIAVEAMIHYVETLLCSAARNCIEEYCNQIGFSSFNILDDF